MTGRPTLLLLLLLLFGGCARENFFQQDARYIPTEKEGQRGLYPPLQEDSVWATAGRHYKRSRAHNLLWGKHYRDVWAQPVKAPIVNLDTTKGGLEPTEMGGGFQSTSLRLQNPQQQTFVLRSLDKNPYEVLPKFWRNTFLVNLLRDQTSAANPYGAFVIPPLAEAAGIFHTNPQLVYVPKALPALADYDSLMGGRLFLLEERFDNEKALTPHFGNATDLVESEDMLENRFAQNTHKIDQQLFAKSRLFDMWIGDWDRHQGQWQWAVYDTNNITLYKPVPMDRDQVFYRFDGIVPGLVSKFSDARKFETFDHSLNNIKNYNINARFIDARALNEVTREQFRQLARELQARLTDNVIDSAMQHFPKNVYPLTGPETAKLLKARRGQLVHAADKFYELLAKHIEIPGTDEKEKFMVERRPDGETRVTVLRKVKKNEPRDSVYYQRTFYPKETKSITLYGLGEEDEFVVQGKAERGIRVIVVGGMGEDKLTDTSSVKGWRKYTVVKDTRRGIELKGSRETKDKRSRKVAVNAYDREGL